MRNKSIRPLRRSEATKKTKKKVVGEMYKGGGGRVVDRSSTIEMCFLFRKKEPELRTFISCDDKHWKWPSRRCFSSSFYFQLCCSRHSSILFINIKWMIHLFCFFFHFGFKWKKKNFFKHTKKEINKWLIN